MGEDMAAFLDEPLSSSLEFHPDDPTGATVQKKTKSFGQTSMHKIITTKEPLRSFPDGLWFEIDIQSFRGGFLQEIGIGFTQTTPEEQKALAEAESFPLKANKMP